MNDSLIKSSFKYCKKIAREHYENFPVASLLVPSEKRKYIYSIYAFARAADDFADEQDIEGGADKKLSLLDEWHQKLIDCYKGKSYDPIFIALGKTVRDCKIPIQEPEKLLNAFRQDVKKNRYESFAEVLDYCKNSADPVGRIVLMINGYNDKELFELSDKICTGLQLINFWQDVELDLQKDRVYIPEEDMKRFGYTYEDLFNRKYNDNFIKLMEFQIKRTEKIFHEGKKLLEILKRKKVSMRINWELRLTWLGGNQIIKKLREVNYNVFEKRPVISLSNKLNIILKSFSF
ncbi:MAG: squalene synthase HpnC [Ignavibacteria bacterium]|nr:squalene synthase HpnC [Ignavibacteria bacterium]